MDICKSCEFYFMVKDMPFYSATGLRCQSCEHNPYLEDLYKEKLKPCPFCGSEARMVHDSEKDEWTIECTNSMCGASIMWYTSKEAAYNIWNERIKSDEIS